MKNIKPETRILGIDDAPFQFSDDTTELIGCLYRGGRSIEAVLRKDITVDGFDATAKIASMVTDSRHSQQIHAVMLDGITFGGFNIIDLQELHSQIQRPILALSRRNPDKKQLKKALKNVSKSRERLKRIEQAGHVYQKQQKAGTLYFQFQGTDQETAEQLIDLSTNRGILPEPVRTAHLIAAGIKTGESKGNA